MNRFYHPYLAAMAGSALAGVTQIEIGHELATAILAIANLAAGAVVAVTIHRARIDRYIPRKRPQRRKQPACRKRI